MDSGEVLFRLLRSNDIPATNPHNLAYRFGLQDTKGNIIAGTTRDDGKICFDFSLKVKEGKDLEHPVFTGQYASGPGTTASCTFRGGRSSENTGLTGSRLVLQQSIGRWFQPLRNRVDPSLRI